MNACSVELRQEIYSSDAYKIVDWLQDNEVNKYLNERQNVCSSIRQVIQRVNMPILTHLFNQNGSFFMVTTDSKEPIGFLRLVPKVKKAEIVVTIGDRDKWGKGFGSSAVFQGLKQAFFEWRANEVVAKINMKNERSLRLFKRLGFQPDKELSKEIQYSISMDKFLYSLKEGFTVSQSVLSKATREFLIKHLVNIEDERVVILKEFFPQTTLESIEFEKLVAGYIKGIEDIITHAQISDEVQSSIPFALIGSVVEIEDMYDQTVDTIQIISPFLNQGSINYTFASYLSPMGKALLLKKKGDKVDIKTPSGVASYIVKDVKFPYF